MKIYLPYMFWLCVYFVFFSFLGQAQVISLRGAVQTALRNYPSIKEKNNLLQSSNAGIREARNEALPDIVFSAQQDFGTVNGQNGPANAIYGYSLISGGPVGAHQNWNAGFGGLYLANVNWDFFAFGKARERIKVSEKIHERAASDKGQEEFQLQIRVSAAYLNLLTAQYLVNVEEANLVRTETLKTVVLGRAIHGLTAGVDSSQAEAEVASAKIALLRAQDVTDEQASRLAVLLGVPSQKGFMLDSVFMNLLPVRYGDSALIGDKHPVLQFYRSRVVANDEAVKYTQTFKYPTFSLFGVNQTRASDFGSSYNGSKNSYSTNYWDGVWPSRTNYLVGIGVSWNFSSLFRFEQQARSQTFQSKALQNEYDLAKQELLAQQQLASAKMANALASLRETPAQIKAANDSYRQRSQLYKIGLSNITDVTQALYDLNRAETDQAISHINVWQALLLKAAAQGDLSIFMNQF